jgi:serine/threonine-protein kinase RsbW
MTDGEWQITIPARFDAIQAATRLVAGAGRAAGLSEQAIHHCQLSIDETCTNIIEHGYGGESAAHSITLVYRVCAPGCLRMEISDSAPPFDPLGLAAPDAASDPTQRQPGGWGVSFVRRLMDDATYRYEAGRNRLTLVKCARDDSAPP